MPAPVFAAALVLGGAAELVFAVFLVRSEMRWRGPHAGLAAIRPLVAGFGRDNFARRALQPMAQLLVGQILGSAATGLFTVALRIPASVNQALSEALRALLPGVAHLLGTAECAAATALIRNAVATQAVLILPIGALLHLNAPVLLELWLGDGDARLIATLRILVLAMCAVSLAAPFYWAAQASGAARAIGNGGLLQVGWALGAGSAALWATGEVAVFAGVYAAGQIGFALFSVWVLQRATGLSVEVLNGLHLPRMGVFLGWITVVNLAVSQMTEGWLAAPRLVAVCAGQAVFVLPLCWVIVTRGLFRRLAPRGQPAAPVTAGGTG